VELEVTCWGGDAGRVFDILANDQVIATVELKNEKPGEFIAKRYPLPKELLETAPDGRVTVKFQAKKWLAGGVFEVRLMKPESAATSGR
jgi:hypothetical protein